MVTKTWKVYASNEPKSHSYRCDWSNSTCGPRIIEVLNHDKTGSTEYSLVKITRNTEDECNIELFDQIVRGIWSSEIVITKIVDV